MKRIMLLVAVAMVAGAIASMPRAPRAADGEAAPVFVTKIIPGYRDWRFISVAHEEGALNDIRVILGNDTAIKAYRENKLPFPEGTIIARICLETCSIRGKQQSLWPCPIICSWKRSSVVSPVHGQALQKILRNGRLGVRSI